MAIDICALCGEAGNLRGSYHGNYSVCVDAIECLEAGRAQDARRMLKGAAAIGLAIIAITAIALLVALQDANATAADAEIVAEATASAMVTDGWERAQAHICGAWHDYERQRWALRGGAAYLPAEFKSVCRDYQRYLR